MSAVYTFKGVVFDDVVDDRADNGEDWDNKWSQICDTCLGKHPALKPHVSDNDDECFCGVLSCMSDKPQECRYIDFGREGEEAVNEV